MKIHTRFFDTFFCFALFFAFSSYLAQDAIFKYNQNREDTRVAQQLDNVRNILNDETVNYKDYFRNQEIDLARISFNNSENKVVVTKLGNLHTNLATNFIAAYQNKNQIDQASL